jgi:hypothetical protein
VAVTLDADGELAEALGRSGVLLVTVDGKPPEHVGFKSLLHGHGAVVYRFASAAEVRIRYAVERNLAGLQPGAFRLEQHLSDATIIDGTAPWGAQVTTASLTETETNCAATSPSGTSCGVEYTISPFVAYGDGSFSDVGCCGPSGPITVTFSAPVSAVTATIYDPTYAGSHMVAHSALGDFTADFAYSGHAGTNIPDTQTLEAPGIYSVDLVPSSGIASGDWVTWRLWFGAGPSIIVSCTPNPVVRGEQAVCTARSSDTTTAPLTMISWKFEGPALSGAITESSTSTTWSGVIATAGTVEAHGTLAGSDATGTTQLGVTARTWNQPSDTALFSIAPGGTGPLPEHPTGVDQLGFTDPQAEAFTAPDNYALITNGPNDGVLYVTKVPVRALVTVYVNYVAMSLGSDFYNKQPKRRTGIGNVFPTCSRDDVLAYVPKVEAHEGLHMETGSHSYVYHQELNRLVPQLTEPVVALGDVEALRANAQSAAEPGFSQAYELARDLGKGGGTVLPIVDECKFRFYNN